MSPLLQEITVTAGSDLGQGMNCVLQPRSFLRREEVLSPMQHSLE